MTLGPMVRLWAAGRARTTLHPLGRFEGARGTSPSQLGASDGALRSRKSRMGAPPLLGRWCSSSSSRGSRGRGRPPPRRQQR